MWKFLRSEMLVVLGLVEDANRTDAEVADLYDMNKGTVSSCRRRLLDAGAIYYSYVPAFGRLGCEMLGFHYGTTDPAVRSDAKANHYMDFCSESPQIYDAMIGGNAVFFFTALRNATEMEHFVLHHNKFFTGSRRASKAKLASVIFPFSMSRMTAVPQYAPIVHNFFQLEVPPPRNVPVSSTRHDPAELNPAEKRTLSSIVANPSATDRQIAPLAKLSRQGVTRIRNELVEEGLITKICIPRLYRWGFEICAVAHTKFSTDISWDRRIKTQPRDVVERVVYTLSKVDEAVASFMVSKFSEYSKRLENILAWYHKVKAFAETPDIIIFSLDRSTELRTFDCAPAVSHLLRAESD